MTGTKDWGNSQNEARVTPSSLQVSFDGIPHAHKINIRPILRFFKIFSNMLVATVK